MKRRLVLLLILLLVPSIGWSVTYTVDPSHSVANFSVKHLMITNVKGNFSDMTGRVTFDEAKPEQSTFFAQILVASIDTDNKERDDHLRSPDFFDAAKHPNISYQSTRVEKIGPALYKLEGDMTIHGVTKPVEFNLEGLDQEIKDPWGNIKRGARLTGSIDRRDFGMTWNKAIETGGVVVGHEVKIEVELQLVRQ